MNLAKRWLWLLQKNKSFSLSPCPPPLFPFFPQHVNSVIEGYNGTVFAYGQTGSGKTFTITGGAENYEQRGLIPRILEFLFAFYAENPDREFHTRVSYLELYNESGYDLLGKPQEGKVKGMEDLPKVRAACALQCGCGLLALCLNSLDNLLSPAPMAWLFLFLFRMASDIVDGGARR